MELLELEKELAGPEKAAAMVRCDAQLVALQARVKAALARGLAPDAYAKCAALDEAVVIARKLLRIQVRGSGEAAVGARGATALPKNVRI